jgi:CBS domain-containing protein
MKVEHIMSRDVHAISPETTIQVAAQKIRQLNISTLPVIENERLVGIVRDHDIAARVVANGKDAHATPIAEIMFRDVKYCYADEPIETIARRMAEEKIQRLPVLNRTEKVVGFLALSDISAQTDGLARKIVKSINEPSAPLTISPYTQEKLRRSNNERR